MNDRDCANCGNRSDRGCKVWECEFKPVFSESKQPIIEELKKIKEERGEAYPYFDSADVHWGFNICRDIIDKHISELKGE